MKQVTAQGVLVGTLADGNNIRSANQVTEIATNSIEGNTNAAVLVIPQIADGELVSCDYIVSRAEQRQMTFIGLPTNTVASPTKEVVVASTATVPKTYQITVENQFEDYESGLNVPGYYTYTAPITLSGDAGTDRYNMFASLATKINNHTQNHVEAFVVEAVAFTVGATALLVPGETLTQATSGATAIVVGQWVGAGDITTGDATGLLYLHSVGATWSASALVSTGGTSTGVVTTTALTTAGEGIAIVDDAGYFPSGESSREGGSVVRCTKGFTVYTPAYGEDNTLTAGALGYTAGLRHLDQRGIGTRMLEDKPVYNRDGSDVVQGLAHSKMWNDVDPVAGAVYTQVNFHIKKDTHKSNAGHIGGEPASQTYIAWVDEASSRVAAFLAQIATNTGVTPVDIS